MSGINEIKKKAKLSIEEMYDSQMVGKMEIKKNGNQENQQNLQMDNHPTSNSHPANNFEFSSDTTIQKTGQPENHLDLKMETQTVKPPFFTSAKQQTQKLPTYKMTFTLTESIYKAFNDIYAQRILQGRKTEKSEIICEAIQWLIKMEGEQI